MRRKFYFTFDAGEVMDWRYCPRCGSKLLEVYPGDFTGHISCMNDDCTEDEPIDFAVEWRDE